MLTLSVENIRDLESTYGFPLYIFNQDEFEENYRSLKSTFCEIYPNYHICYSYKTNYTPEICQCVKDWGLCRGRL